MNAPELLSLLLKRLHEDLPTAVVTIVSSRGSIPNAVGAKMLVDAEGKLLAGTVGGGEIEWQGQQEAARALAEGRSRSFGASLTEKAAHGIGMMCGGSCELFIEVHLPQPRLVLMGGGHINIEIAKLGRGLGLPAIVVDDRAEWANPEHYPGATVHVASPTEAAARIDWRASDYLLVATASSDTECLRLASDLPCRYVGLVASKRKTVQILKNLASEGRDLTGLKARLRAPVGLDLGGKTPEAIALSVMAEIQAHRNGRDARPLSFVDRAPVARAEAGA